MRYVSSAAVRECDGDAGSAKAKAIGYVALLGVATMVLLLSFAGGYGYQSDELYFLDCAAHPAWGYADLPPLLPWLTWIATNTLGSSLWAIRFYPAVAAGVATLLTGYLTAELGGARRAIIAAGVLVFLAPVTLGFGHTLSTNALDMSMWLLCVILLVRIENTGQEWLWIAFGAAAGMGLLHKYTLVFLFAALIVSAVLTSWRRHFASRWFWAGMALACVIVLPNLVWQARHDYPFLQLQHFNRVSHHNVVLPPLQFLAAQLLLQNPFSALFTVAGAVFLFTPAMRRFRALGWTFIVFVLLMFMLHARDYYLAAVYPPMFAAGAVASERWLPSRWAGRAVSAYLAIAALFTLLVLPVVLPLFSPERTIAYIQYIPIHRTEPENLPHTVLPNWVSDQFGWREAAETVANYYNALSAEERAKTAIFGYFYGEAGAVDHFGPALGLPKAIGSHHTYWFWGPRNYTGESVIFMDPWPEILKHCTSVTVVGQPENPWARPHDHPNMYHCRGLDFDLRQEWERFRHFD